MRAKIEYIATEGSATLIRVTGYTGKESTVKVFSDGSRLTKAGPDWLVEKLFRAGRKASDKEAFRAAIERARESGAPVEMD
jgi:hypothetical protein